MNRKIKKISLVIACLVIFAIMLSGCGGGSGTGETTAAQADNPDPTGTYHAQLDLTEYMNEAFGSSLGIDFTTSVAADLELELADDGNFTLSIDAETLENSIKKALETEGPDIFKMMFIEMDVDEEDLEGTAQQMGYDSFDALVDELIAQAIDQMEEQGIGDLVAETNAEGTYTVDEDKIELTLLDGDGGETISTEGSIKSDGNIEIDIKFNGTDDISVEFSKLSDAE